MSSALLQKTSLMGRMLLHEVHDEDERASFIHEDKRSFLPYSVGNVSQERHDNVILASGIQTYAAYQRFKPCRVSLSGVGSSPAECSPECPFWQYDPAKSCNFFCVAAKDCKDFGDPLQNFAKHSTMTCTTCKVPGCKACGTRDVECKMCLVGYELIGGKCYASMRHTWWIVYGVLIFIIVLVVVYVVTLWWRPNDNNTVMREAIEYRHRAKERNMEESNALYSLKTNILGTFISGAGVMLHFRFQVVVIAWSLLVFVATLSLKFLSKSGQSYSATLDAPSHSTIEGMKKCMEGSAAKHFAEDHNVLTFDREYIWFLLGVYAATTLGALAFAFCQRSFFTHADERYVCMENYALYASGFPNDAGENLLEEEYAEFVRKAVSLAMSRDGSSGGLIRTCVITKENIEEGVIEGNKLPYAP